MALGRRGRRSERAKLDATPPWATEKERDTDVTTGPYDELDSPDDEMERLDLGALRIPVMAGVEVRVDVNPEGQVIAATLSYGGSEAQVGAFAAPRTAGIWDDIRAEIRSSITSQGGTAEESKGRFGTELTGRVPVQGGYQSVRFVGVDGPRWFLRALFTGPAATEPARAAVLEDAVRNIVVVRGTSPMPVRDPIPLTLPKEIAEQAEQSRGAHAAPDAPAPDPEPADLAGPDEPAEAAEPAPEPAPPTPRPPSGRRRADRRRR
ncbi:MAG TPA: DUF3710 domain-containing protein [Mycobacteriales bacterium]|nr:DUF3710 domain-containing protein [Mycobacteriales bacterium]